jgi:nitrogen-specific signal transduction histidine kinase
VVNDMAAMHRMIFRFPFVTSKHNGRGLGMYISSELVRKYDASIELVDEKSSENVFHGTCFKPQDDS